MAESQDGQERTEQPTAKRLADARTRGQVARSRELTTTIMLIGGSVGLFVFGPYLTEGLMDVMRMALSLSRDEVMDKHYGLDVLMTGISGMLWALAPFLAVMVVCAVAGSTALSGWLFSTKALQPKISKLNPLSGMKRIVGVQGLVELGKSLLKLFLIGGLGILLLWSLADEILALGREPMDRALEHGLTLVFWVFLATSCTLIIVSIVDAPFQVWNHTRQLKMTLQEVKQEHKETDGNPEVKGKIKQLQREQAFRRMMEAVPQADVIVTNPTHFSVALKYDPKTMRAPIIIAKGADFVAHEIRRVATEHNIPIMSSPALARAIYFTTEIDDEVPEGLYMAVAQVLAYIFQLRKASSRRAQSDSLKMTDVPIPDDMQFDANHKPGRKPWN